MGKRIGLALSGGGARAMIFHAGVLQWLAENMLLEQVVAISSVSGGSLLTGLVYRFNDWKWPSSRRYLTHVLPCLRELLTTVCLEREARRLLLGRPANWRYLFSRANILADAITRAWGVDTHMDALDSACDWSINGTTAETGRRFRFKRGRCGDYRAGYASASAFPLSVAMAASAAYPLLVGPLRLDATQFQWYRRSDWGGSEADETPVAPAHRTLHIIDGGVYDNLGMEPLFDTGTRTLRSGLDYLVVSDAGAPFHARSLQAQWNPARVTRILEILMDQSRALRVRPYVNAIIDNPNLGRYYRIGSDPEESLSRLWVGDREAASSDAWLSAMQVKEAAAWATDLKRVKPETFDLIARHGFETAKWNEMLFSRKRRLHH
ncbi:patatin-like phospholipase family protein [Caballeronia sp. GAFFF1]|uniref:patatin-like phospholipase family protein n=1 Tax=Caballeronia sp. GAFFF1 TaxID=2921779 RepID=UPI002027ADFB|nr:patatin-like phospholipase family protein [Caballeronia sp. GAFFF1]